MLCLPLEIFICHNYHYHSQNPKYIEACVKDKLASAKSFQLININLHVVVTKFETFQVDCLFLRFKNANYDISELGLTFTFERTVSPELQCGPRTSPLSFLANN